MSICWTKDHRLTRRGEFLACYEQGKKYQTRHFIIYAQQGRGRARLGLTVSRKCGNSVERNRIKRVLREFFRLNQATIPIMDIVIIPKRSLKADQIDLSMVRDDFSPLLKRLAVNYPAAQDSSSPHAGRDGK